VSAQSLAELVAQRFASPLIRPQSDPLRVERSSKLMDDEWFEPLSKLTGIVGRDNVERVATKEIRALLPDVVGEQGFTRIRDLMLYLGWEQIQMAADGRGKGNAVRGYMRRPDRRPGSKPEVLPAVIDDTSEAVIALRGAVVKLDGAAGKEFTVDLARNIEMVLADVDFVSRYQLTDDGWKQMGKNAHLHDAVRQELDLRIRRGIAPKEAAQVFYAQAPKVLAEIMHDRNIGAQHRIAAAKDLEKASGNQIQPGEQQDRITLTITLGPAVEPIRIEADAPAPEPKGLPEPPAIEHEETISEPPPTD
jgi:hypothetical protein